MELHRFSYEVRGLSRHTTLLVSFSVMPGLVPPARPKPLRRGEGPGIHAALRMPNDVDGRDKPGHDDMEIVRHVSSNCCIGPEQPHVEIPGSRPEALPRNDGVERAESAASCGYSHLTAATSFSQSAMVAICFSVSRRAGRSTGFWNCG